jgi:hypothetical protein
MRQFLIPLELFKSYCVRVKILLMPETAELREVLKQAHSEQKVIFLQDILTW